MKSTNMSKNEIPMKRFANPKEIADVVIFLLGPGSSYITVSRNFACIIAVANFPSYGRRELAFRLMEALAPDAPEICLNTKYTIL
jgi:hypothetical protein